MLFSCAAAGRFECFLFFFLPCLLTDLRAPCRLAWPPGGSVVQKTAAPCGVFFSLPQPTFQPPLKEEEEEGGRRHLRAAHTRKGWTADGFIGLRTDGGYGGGGWGEQRCRKNELEGGRTEAGCVRRYAMEGWERKRWERRGGENERKVRQAALPADASVRVCVCVRQQLSIENQG